MLKYYNNHHKKYIIIYSIIFKTVDHHDLSPVGLSFASYSSFSLNFYSSSAFIYVRHIGHTLLCFNHSSRHFVWK